MPEQNRASRSYMPFVIFCARVRLGLSFFFFFPCWSPGLFCAALLSRCGRRVLVLEQGPLVGAGAVVKAPEGAGDWEFETGVQCLGGGGKLGRFVKRLQLACLPGRGTLGRGVGLIRGRGLG